MTNEEIIRSLEDQAKDKKQLADGDLESISTQDASALISAATLLRSILTQAQEKRPPCYIEEKRDTAYPLCAGRGFANCAHCAFWTDLDEDQDESRVNRPLTQKELQWMDGEPVWIVQEGRSGRWDLIRRRTTSGISTYVHGFLAWADCGKIWRAYRYRLEPSANEEETDGTAYNSQ